MFWFDESSNLVSVSLQWTRNRHICQRNADRRDNTTVMSNNAVSKVYFHNMERFEVLGEAFLKSEHRSIWCSDTLTDPTETNVVDEKHAADILTLQKFQPSIDDCHACFYFPGNRKCFTFELRFYVNVIIHVCREALPTLIRLQTALS